MSRMIAWRPTYRGRELKTIEEVKAVCESHKEDVIDGLKHQLYNRNKEIEQLRTNMTHDQSLIADLIQENKQLKIERETLQAYAKHERSLGAEGPMIELTQARQEIQDLKIVIRNLLLKLERTRT